MFDKIKSDLLESMKSGDKFKLGVLRMLKSALQMEQISLNHELNDDEVLTVIRREVKKRNSSIIEYEKFNKLDTVEDLKHEISILEEYLPAMLSNEEIEKIIGDKIAVIKSKKEASVAEVSNKLNSKMQSLISKIITFDFR